MGLVEDIRQLQKDQQEMLREQIRLRYFMPVIKKIMEIKEELGYAYWHVDTSFGNYAL